MAIDQNRVNAMKTYLQNKPQPTASSGRVSAMKEYLEKKQQQPAPVNTPEPEKPDTYLGMRRDGPLDPQKVFGIGIGALKQVGRSGAQILDQTAGRLGNMITGQGNTPTTISQNLAPQNTQEKIGSVAEQGLEFLAPQNIVSKGQKAVDVALDGIKWLPKIGKSVASVLGKAAVEGGSAAATSLYQTLDTKQAKTAGLFAGGAKTVTGTVGQVLKAANVPEWLYSKVFKTTSRDIMDEFKTLATGNLQKENPELFNQLKTAGIIQTAKDGSVKVNETLAKEAVSKGLAGSLKNMAQQTVQSGYKLELQARDIAKNYKTPIPIPEQYANLLREVEADYKNVGFGEISQQAKSIADKIQNNITDADNLLKLRRFLDGMRIRSSFNPATKLTQTQINFKTLADKARGTLAEIPGMAQTMDNYRFNIEALDSLSKEAARRNNREVVGLIDSMFFGSGVAVSEPLAGAGLGLLRRFASSPTALTNIGQAIEKGTQTKAGALKNFIGPRLINRANQDNQ